MIYAGEINKLMNLDRFDLSRILARSGYTGCTFEDARFLGLTESGDFCYLVEYYDDAGTGESQADKVYIRRDKATGEMVADF